MASRIAGITVEINGSTTGLSKSLESVNKTIKTTQTQLKDVERLLKLDPSNTELLSQKQQALATKITATKEKLEALKTAQEQAKQQMENGDLGKEKYDALQREIIATEQELKNLAREAAEANTALNKIDAVGRTLENVGGKMTAVGSSLTRNVTAPIVALGAAAIKTTADFDEQMSKVSAISGATGKDFDDLRAKAREMGAKTKFSATEAGQAFEYMAMAGWKTGDMLDGIEGIMNLAAASGEDLATTSDIVTDALTAFGLSAKDSGHFADVLAAASSNANTNVSMLGESFKYAAPVAGALGINAEDTSVALGLMANAGIKASQAGTSLRTGLTNLAKPTKQMQTYMDKYNIALVENDDGSINLRDTMIDLREKMGGLSESEQAAAASAIFGKNSMAGWLAIINASDQDFEKLTTAIDNCDGSAEEMAATMQDNLAGQITILKSALQELAIQIGDALMPTIRNIVSKIQAFVEKLQQMDEGTRNTILKLAAFAAAIGPVLLVVGKLTTGVGKAMQGIADMGKHILTFVNEAKLGVGAGGKFAAAIAGIGPVGWVIIAVVAALTAAFVHLWKTSDEFKTKITGHWDKLKAKMSEVGQKITEAFNKLGFSFKDVAEVFDWLCNQVFAPLLDFLLGSVMDCIGDIIEVFGGVIEVIVGIIKGFKDGDWSILWQGLSDIATGIINLLFEPIQWLFHLFGVELEDFNGDWGNVWTGIKNFFTGIWNAISTFFTGIWNGIKNTVTTVVTAIGTAISTAWNAVKTTFQTVWGAITGVVSKAWETIKNVVQVGVMFIKELFSAAFQILTIPFRFIWENCKEAVTTAWEAIKSAVSKALEAIKTAIQTVWTAIWTVLSPIINTIKTGITTAWEAIKTAVTTVVNTLKTTLTTVWNAIWTALSPIVTTIKTGITTAWNAIKTTITTVVNAIKTTITTVWNAIKTTVTTVTNGIKTAVSTGWNAIKTNVGTVMTGIKTSISTAWNGIKTNVSTAVNGVKSTITTGFNAAKSSVTSIFNGIKGGIGNAMSTAKNAVSNAISAIKNKFNFSWSLPHLKMPHLSISGKFSINPPSVPHFSISWYKKAMDEGMILNSPTIFGRSGNTLLAGGEAGSEAVVGTQSLMEMIRNAVASMAGQTTINYGGVNINLYAQPNQDIRELADEIEYRINNNVMRRRAALGT